ncbi:Y-linked testis-specific protein 1-like [Rattus norvegicus]|uniref:Y-linked testis-specific protein 1-like n=1 Tax=Rattus norvegicus TaxID=10116 RepID=UPI002FD84FDA
MVGRAVEHKFEGKHGSKDNWRWVVLAQVPIMKNWFYITYEKDPVLYIYQLLDDYTEGNLRIIPETPPAEVKSDVDRDILTGQFVQFTRGGRSKILAKSFTKFYPSLPFTSSSVMATSTSTSIIWWKRFVKIHKGL